MSNLSQDLIATLRMMANKGLPISGMVEEIRNRESLDMDNRLVVIAYFQEAFGLPLKKAVHITRWSGFNGGTADDNDIHRIIMGYIGEFWEGLEEVKNS